jgi:hypothetical protein
MRSVPTPHALVIPSALVDPQDSAFVQALAGMRLPHLTRLLARSRVLRSPEQPAQRLSTVHEWAQAQAWGWTPTDGLLPWAAWHAQVLGLDTRGEQAWAVFTLCHWHVAQGQVILESPARLGVTPAESDSLRLAMQAYCAQDGITLHPWVPGQWLAASDLFRGLPTANPDRVVGLAVEDGWVGAGLNPPSPAAQHLRRLQNEMQMLFYTHACNETRPTAINSFWISGTGDLAAANARSGHLAPTAHAGAKTATMSPSHGTPVTQSVNGDGVRSQPAWQHPAVQRLHQAAQMRHVAAWVEAWHEVDDQLLAPLADTPTAELVLCGSRHACVVQCQPSAWPQWWRTWRAPPLEQALLDR